MGVVADVVRFLCSKSARSFVLYLAFCAALSAAIGTGFYYSNLRWFKEHKGEEKVTALQLVDAFVTNYAAIRSQFGGNSPVPATFRAHSIDRFNQQSGSKSDFRLRWVGRRGREIVTPPADSVMADTIEAFARETAPQPKSDFLPLDGNLMFRTVYPSLARDQSCVDCHNKLQPEKTQWQLNDVMGAFVIDVPAAGFLARNLLQSVGVALGLFLALSVVGLIISFLYFRQMAQREAAAVAEIERSRAIAEAEVLRQQEQVAEAANRAKSNFLAVMSHEIRTPMNAVLGLANTLLETPLNAEQRQSVVTIQSAGDGLLEILNDILDFSKLEAGRVEFEAIAFSPGNLIHDVISIIRPRALAKDLAIREEEEPSVPSAVVGDAGRIRQVLLNLASNAVKFTASGEIKIIAKCLARDQGRATIEWTVTDTGIGIPANKIGSLFAEFVQADTSINRRFGGSGLGLAICKRLIEQMGGEITVESVLNQGSTFRFALTLPLAEAPVTSSEQNDLSLYAELKTQIAALKRPLRVLIADDNPANRLVAAKMLKEFDVQANQVADGAEALNAATRFAFDVILMDVRMPEVDGLQATRAIRAHGGPLAAVPIIAFTANAFEDDVNACAEAGMDAFITKPVRKRELVAVILRVIRAARSAAGKAEDGACNEWALASEIGQSVDRSAFEELASEIGERDASETLNVFVNETETRLKMLRRLSYQHDRNTIEREAHSLKSSAGTFGLHEVAEFARRLERDAANISASDYSAILDRLEAAFVSARAQLSAQISIAA